jgi:phosphonate transport system permease protein
MSNTTNGSAIKRTIFDSILLGYLFIVLIVAVSNPSQEQLLNLKFNSTLFGLLMVGSGILSYFLNNNGLKTLGELIFEPAYKKTQSSQPNMLKTFWGWQLLLFLFSTLTVGIIVTQFSFTELLDQDGFQGAIRLFNGLLSPNLDILPKAVMNIITTIFMAFIATAFAIPIAFLLCFMASKNIMTHPAAFAVYLFLRTIMNVSRSIEALIWAIIFSVWVGIGPFAGMMALMIHSISSLTKQYSEIVETVSEGPIEGILSTGANKIQMIWYAIVPQVFLPFVSFTIYRWDINIRMATIIGLVGGGGIGTMLIQYQGQAMWPEVGCIIMVIAFVVWFMDTASAYLREALK